MVSINVSGAYNLRRVQPLSAQFNISIKDSYGGLVAIGTKTLDQLDILKPVRFSQIKVERKALALASPTDIEVSINLDQVEVLPYSVLELVISKD